MKSKAMIPMLVGVGIGLLALKMGWDYIEKSRVSAAASQGGTTVVVARRDVSAGIKLQLSDLKTADWPRSAVLSEAYSNPEELVGRVSQKPLSEELPILEKMLAPPGTSEGLQALIPRAIRLWRSKWTSSPLWEGGSNLGIRWMWWQRSTSSGANPGPRRR